MNPIVALPTMNGGLLAVPTHDTSRRALNWAAVIDIDPREQGGFSRVFIPKGRGPSFFIIERVMLYDAIEFAGDRIAWSGNKVRNRWHGVVISVMPDYLVIAQCDDAAAACVMAHELKQGKRPMPDTVQAQVYRPQKLLKGA